jgi:hypothetical protein
MGLSGNDRCVCNDGWFVKLFFAAFVWAYEFFLVVVTMEKLNVNRLRYALTSSMAIFNKPYRETSASRISTTQLHQATNAQFKQTQTR